MAITENCEHWTQDTSAAYQHSGICQHYGRMSQKCWREYEGKQDDRPQICQWQGRKEIP